MSPPQARIAKPMMRITTRSSNPDDAASGVRCRVRTERGRASMDGPSVIRSALMITAPSHLSADAREPLRVVNRRRDQDMCERRAAWPCRASELPIAGQLDMGDTAPFLIPPWRDRGDRFSARLQRSFRGGDQDRWHDLTAG